MKSLIGVDTDWLVHCTLAEAAGHAATEAALCDVIAAGETRAIAPQVMWEFVHVVTDSRRFVNPMTMDEALDAVDTWWNAPEVVQTYPTVESVRLGWEWMHQFRLGRKRILDTHLAALFHIHGIVRVLTLNARDYAVFGCFQLL